MHCRPVDADESPGEKERQERDVQSRALLEHTDRVTGLACIGHTLVSVSWDLSLRLWNLQSALQSVHGASSHWVENAHDDYILSVAFSPELQQIATSSADQVGGDRVVFPYSVALS